MTTFSKTENRILMNQARESLKGKWGLAVGAHLLSFIISMVAGFSIALILMMPITFLILTCGLPEEFIDISANITPGGILTGPLTIGLSFFGLSLSRSKNIDIMQIFHGFKNKRFLRGFLAWLLMGVFILLWCLLLIIPGIIKCFSYALTYYIMADDDSIAPLDAISKSKDLMYGNKAKLFCLYFRFFGWALLSICTCCLGFIWLFPYMNLTVAKFYDDIKKNNDELNDSQEDTEKLNEEKEGNLDGAPN